MILETVLYFVVTLSAYNSLTSPKETELRVKFS